MTNIYLENMVENLRSLSLPPNWNGFDLSSFSPGKNLWEYQQNALENALWALWKYFSLNGEQNDLKHEYMQWYLDYGLEDNLDLPVDRSSFAKRKVAALLEDFYEAEEDKVPYWQFINRMSFWMATGSGKTLVIVKMLEMLWNLIQRGEIPAHDILVLAHRDDLLEQLRSHVQDFNAGGGLFIHLKELREYPEVKRQSPSLFEGQEATVFYYRSDNLSDEQKERIIDFRNYDNYGQWYILLDEAHKGDKEDSKRQHIYSILSRNGFLFNFSATFTDPRDIITTVANYNLSEFIRKGHGKHISILKQEVSGFRDKGDYSDEEKQKIVLKALIMLTYVRKFEKKVRAKHDKMYHRPLMMTLVNSVNTEDADLKLFFRELVRIGKGEIDDSLWQQALTELQQEFNEYPSYLYEPNQVVKIDRTLLGKLTQADLLTKVFNANGTGEIEVLVRPSNRQEVAFKLKTSDDPFALVRIGDISDWLKQELSGYEINTRFTDEGYFARLNNPDSDINILLGSRSFYEGWDSNRPNVIMYINIGVGTDAKKFILQSVGRGVRIEPIKNQRKRLRELYTSGQLQKEIFDNLKDLVFPLESVYVFGTNRDALEKVIEELDQEKKKVEGEEIALQLNSEIIAGNPLLIPTYRFGDLLYKKQEITRLTLHPSSHAVLLDYLDYMKGADVVLLARHNTTPAQISALREFAAAKNIRVDKDVRPHKSLDVLMQQTLTYFSSVEKEFHQFKQLEDEIKHFQHIKVLLEPADFAVFMRNLDRFYEAPQLIMQLREKYDSGQLSFEEILEQTKKLQNVEGYEQDGSVVQFRNIARHYYLPLLVSEDEKLDFVRSIIKVRSEVKFLNDLEEYLKQDDHLFKHYDWWMFSRIDEKSDDITIPYYNPYDNKVLNFRPDFIFWLKKEENYTILFVDPKGTSRAEYQHKVDGFRALFEKNEKPITFSYMGMQVQVRLFLHTTDTAFVAEYYRKYWQDDIGKMMKCVIG
jgi:superfamily II DNA or RNA helicase